jgi:hypothetical protein
MCVLIVLGVAANVAGSNRVGPSIHFSLKFFCPCKLSTNLALPFRNDLFVPSFSTTQLSHDVVWCSRFRYIYSIHIPTVSECNFIHWLELKLLTNQQSFNSNTYYFRKAKCYSNRSIWSPNRYVCETDGQ